ncbi:MAG: hypothetical protein EHM61_06840 [Acidobacteria bacterium]|nr:MAG: hypothetical protein EHM61_06840 [Acidobacteriota bacterium]
MHPTGIRAETAVSLLVALLLAALPFVVSPGGLEKFRLPKDVVFGVSATLIAGIFFGANGVRRLWKWRSWEGLLLLAVGYLVANSLWNRRGISAWAVCWVVGGVLLLLAVSRGVPQADHPRLWLVLGSASAVNAFLALLQYYGRFPLLIRSSGETLEGRLTPAGLIGDVNTGGFVFGLAALMLLYPLAAQKKPGLRIFAGGLLALNLVGLIITQTLSAMLGFGVAFVLWLGLHGWWLVHTHKNPRKAYGLTAAAMGSVVLVLLVVFLVSGTGERITGAWSAIRAGDPTEWTAGRYPVYLITWRMIRDYPVLGRGLGSFGVDFFRYRTETDLSRLTMIDQPGAFREAHNDYLQVWEELGLVGLALFLGLLVIPCVEALRKARVSKDPKSVYRTGMLVLGMVFTAIACLAFFPFRLSLTALCVVLLLAGLRSIAHQPDEKTHQPLPASQSWRWRAVLLGVVTVIVLYYGVQHLRANSEMGLAAEILERGYSPSLSPRAKRIYAETALVRLRRAEAMSPIYENYNLQGSANILLGNHEEAARQYERAARYIPSPEVLTNQAAALLAIGQKEKARRLLETALKYNPNYPNASRALEYLKSSQN